MNFLGCLLILIFGGIFFILALARQFLNLLFGGGRPTTGRTSSGHTSSGRPHASNGNAYGPRQTSAGNARHEQSGGHPNSRQRRRSGKIFEKDEGRYVDFEEV